MFFGCLGAFLNISTLQREWCLDTFSHFCYTLRNAPQKAITNSQPTHAQETHSVSVLTHRIRIQNHSEIHTEVPETEDKKTLEQVENIIANL